MPHSHKHLFLDLSAFFLNFTHIQSSFTFLRLVHIQLSSYVFDNDIIYAVWPHNTTKDQSKQSTCDQSAGISFKGFNKSQRYFSLSLIFKGPEITQ